MPPSCLAGCSLSTTHAPGLVVLSIVIAAIASYVALDLAGRTAAATGRVRRVWLTGGSLAMGVGIWSMHFVGMLAFGLHGAGGPHAMAGGTLPVSYDAPLLLASVGVAVAASGLALSVVAGGRLGARAFVSAGVLLGLAIAGMHYVGMAAMRMPARLGWNVPLVAASLVVAIGTAMAALWLLARLGNVRSTRERWAKGGAAAVMGLAIAGMHYTGMAAARFAPPEAGPAAGWLPPNTTSPVLATGTLAVMVTLAAVLVLGVALTSTALDRRHRQQLDGTLDALRASEERLRAIFDHAAVGIALHDVEGRILEANHAFQQIVGYSLDELRQMRANELSPPEEADVTRDPVRALLTGACDRVTVEKRFRQKRGAIRRCELTISCIATAGAPTGLVGMLQDVTEHRAAQAELVYRAYHDPLTGLSNRSWFHERVAEALDRASTAGDPSQVAVLLVDLDGFKLVNDSAGHAIGDAVLQQVGERLLNATRGCDLVARLGGDEFGVLLTNLGGEAHAARVAERVIAALGRPVAVHGVNTIVGASVGIARGGSIADRDARDAVTAVAPVDALVRDADLALYAAKGRGRAQYVVFEPAMHAAALERLALEAALRRGIVEGEFFLVYQPIVDLQTDTLIGVEALVRWQHPTRGLVAPAQFIPLAEETGLIRPLGQWVLEAACQQGAAWVAAADAAGRGPAPTVSVNVSGRQLQHAAFVDEVRRALATSGLPADHLVLELTESTIIHHPEVARERLLAVKALGVRVALDDFGTGYSALSYLRQFPIDVLKVDKSFVDHLAESGQPVALAAAIVALGDALSLRTVAEGVETATQAAVLAGMGCALGQGYHFSRPLTAAALTEWWEARGDVPAPDVQVPVGFALEFGHAAQRPTYA